MKEDENERAIRAIIECSVRNFADTFADRHIRAVNNPESPINMKIYNIFISALGKEIQYYSALSRSLDSSLGNMLEKETKHHYLIELKIGGDLDNKKARSEKEALLEQYCILCNNIGSNDNVSIHFATAYNRYGEGSPWTQGRVLQFFSREELLISADFWNLICKRKDGFEIVIDEYKKQAYRINEALNNIKNIYLPDDN